jgi:formate dehydrogenase major subunit
VITTDSSDWATNCPEYKVTAVQVVAVSQPSEWQQRHEAFDRAQQGLLRQGQGAGASSLHVPVEVSPMSKT